MVDDVFLGNVVVELPLTWATAVDFQGSFKSFVFSLLLFSLFLVCKLSSECNPD